MYDYLISEYLNRITTDEIKDFAFKKGIELTDEETDIIYKYAKEHWRTFLHGNPRPILEEVKTKVRPLTYNKIETIYAEVRNKYLT